MKLDTAIDVARRALEQGNPHSLIMYQTKNGQYMTSKDDNIVGKLARKKWELHEFVQAWTTKGDLL